VRNLQRAVLFVFTVLLLAGGTTAWAGRTGGGSVISNDCVDGHFASGIRAPSGTLQCAHAGSASSVAFTNVTGGTNTATLHVGAGSTLAPAATGQITASHVFHRAITGFGGSTGTLGTTSGTLTDQDCVKFDASGNLVTAGAACGIASPAFSSIATGTNTNALHVGTSGTLAITGGGIINANRVAHRTISGFGGSTGTLGTTSGTLTDQDCVKIDASGNLVAAGAACGIASPNFSAIATGTNANTLHVSGTLAPTGATGAITASHVLHRAITGFGGTSATLGTTSGTLTNQDCVKFDANGNLVANGAACASATPAFSAIAAGTNTAALHVGTSGTLSPTAGGIINANRVAHRTIAGFGGNAATLATTTGGLTDGNCVKINSVGDLVDHGSACGGSGSPGGGHNAIQFNYNSAFQGSGNFVWHAVGNVLHIAGSAHISGNLHVAGQLITGGAGAGSIEMTAGAIGIGSAGKVHIGAHTGSILVVSQNAGPIQEVPLCGGDVHCVASNSMPTVKSFTLSQEGQLARSPATSSVPNDITTGTTVNLLAKITHAGAMKIGLTEGNIPVYVVHAGAGTSGSARLVVAGQTTCVMHATATGTMGWHVVAAATGTAGRCHAFATMPSGHYSAGIVLDTSTTAGSAGRVLVGGPSTIVSASDSYRVRACAISVGSHAGSALVDADLGPQNDVCPPLSGAATILEIRVKANDGTPSALPRKTSVGASHTSLLSGALATANAGTLACSNVAGTISYYGTTTCTNTLTVTTLALGDTLGLASGTAGGTAAKMTITIVYRLNASN
jgi:hypothetical protein